MLERKVALWYSRRTRIIFEEGGAERRMELPKDPMILYSWLNVKLRDFYYNLESLCEDMDIDKKELEERLFLAGFRYNEEMNRIE